MPSTFFGITIASSSLITQQTAMNVISHNIANANNPQYRRQQAIMAAAPPYPYPGTAGTSGVGQLGTGTQVRLITRLRDRFIENQILDSNQNLGRWEASKRTLDQVVGIIGEPSDYALGCTLDKFWNSWQELSLNPENIATRNHVLEYGTSVSNMLNRLYTQVEEVRNLQDMAIKASVNDVNRLAKELAAVNDEIERNLGSGNTPNDLLDKRDAILQDLSRIVNIQVFGEGGAEDVITIGGHALVQGNRSMELMTGTDAEGHATVLWASDSTPVDIRSGELAGYMTTQQQILPGYLGTLDDIAQALITRVNEVHRSGYGLDDPDGIPPQRDFFRGSGARDIRINNELSDNPRKISTAASGGSPGDGSIALAISKIKSEKLVSDSTIGELYQNMVAVNGSDAASAASRVEAQKHLHQQLVFQQQSVSGVSLDEEMTDMVRFQQAYNASARVLTVMDEMLDTLVNRVGVGGR